MPCQNMGYTESDGIRSIWHSITNAVDGLTVRDLLHKYLNDPMPEVKQVVLKDMCWNCLWIVHLRDQTIRTDRK